MVKTFYIFCLFLVLSVLTVVKALEPGDEKQYDDNNIGFDAKRFKEIIDLATNQKRASNQYVSPYKESDYVKIGQSLVPNRYKQKLIDNFDKLRNEIGMTAKNAAFDAVRYATEDMMDLYIGRLYSLRDMEQLLEIRRTDPVHFMLYAAKHDNNWAWENDQKLFFGWKEKPDYQVFRTFLRAYVEINSSSPRANQ